MTGIDIFKLYKELEAKYPDWGYVSRATIFGYARKDGLITNEIYMEARQYYGRLWNYTGD